MSKILDGRSIDSISLKLALQEHYETYYKVFNHDDGYVPPLAVVTLQSKERYDPYDRYRRIVKNFAHYGIKELFGYNLTEFLELPRAKIDILMDEAAERKLARDSKEEKLARQVATASQGLG